MIRVVLLCCLLAITAQADVYVSPAGDDAADGATAASAVQTLPRASVLWSQQHRATPLRFERGGVWNAPGLSFEIGQGGSQYGQAVIEDYGDATLPRPVLRGVSLLNAGAGLYNCRVSNLVLEGAGQSETRDGFKATKIVGTVLVEFVNCEFRGWAKAANLQPYLDGRPTVRFTSCLIEDCHSMGILAQTLQHLDMRDTTVRKCAFGSTVGVRTHNNRTHGVYASSCRQLTVDGCVFDDNGSMNLKCTTDEIAGCSPVSITNSQFIDGFFSIGLGRAASDAPLLAPRHKDVTITGNTFTRTRDVTTDRRVDASSNSVTYDYWDRFIRITSAENCIVADNVVKAIDPALSDSPNSVAQTFVVFMDGHPHVNNQVGQNVLEHVAEEFTGDATAIAAPQPTPKPDEPMSYAVELQIDPSTWRVTGTITPIQKQPQ